MSLLPREILAKIAVENRAALPLFRQTCKDFAALIGEYVVSPGPDTENASDCLNKYFAASIVVDGVIIVSASPRRVAFEFLLVGRNCSVLTGTMNVTVSPSARKWVGKNFPMQDGVFIINKGVVGQAVRIIRAHSDGYHRYQNTIYTMLMYSSARDVFNPA